MGHLVVHRRKTIQFLGNEWDVPWASLFARGAKVVAEGANTRRFRKLKPRGATFPTISSAHLNTPRRPRRDSSTTTSLRALLMQLPDVGWYSHASLRDD